MLLARYHHAGRSHIGLVSGDEVRPIGGLPRFRDQALLAIAMGPEKAVHEALGDAVPLADLRLMAPVQNPGKIACVGANYALHAREGGVDLPSHPNIFAKFPSSILDPGRPIVIPHEDATIDYEGELCVVIGRRGRRIPARLAFDYVAGYCVANDVSARTTQLQVSQWVVGKSVDTFCPIGPWLATRSSVPDPSALHLQTTLDGETVQDLPTSAMNFDVPALIEFLSSFVTLEPGDLLLTGTPEGVGATRVPPVYLTPGSRVEVTIDRIGTLSNPVEAETGSHGR